MEFFFFLIFFFADFAWSQASLLLGHATLASLREFFLLDILFLIKIKNPNYSRKNCKPYSHSPLQLGTTLIHISPNFSKACINLFNPEIFQLSTISLIFIFNILQTLLKRVFVKSRTSLTSSFKGS